MTSCGCDGGGTVAVWGVVEVIRAAVMVVMQAMVRRGGRW